MNKLAVVAITAGITLCSAMTFSQGKEKPSPEESALLYRTSIFQALEWKSSALSAAQAKGDAAAFKGHAADMASLASMITEGFIPNSLIEGSVAKQEIWDNWEDFESKAADAESNLAAMAADDYDMTDFDPKTFGRTTCGGCHREYKERH